MILGLTIDHKLSFDNYVKKICRKASQETCALSRISNYLDSKQKEILFKGMIRSHFSYCPLTWMLWSRKSNNLINKVHEMSLRIDTGDNNSSFKSKTIHQRNFWLNKFLRQNQKKIDFFLIQLYLSILWSFFFGYYYCWLFLISPGRYYIKSVNLY